MKKRYFECTPVLSQAHCTADHCGDKRELHDTMQRRLIYGSNATCLHQCSSCLTEYWLDKSYPSIDFMHFKVMPRIIDPQTREYDPVDIE